MVRSIDSGLYRIITPDGSGSGFLVSDRGHIVTNAPRGRRAYFSNGPSGVGATQQRASARPGRILDLAVLVAEPSHDVRPMTLGNASEIRPGDEVIALGFPLSNDLGGDYTVTTGVVSSRRIQTRWSGSRPTPPSTLAAAAAHWSTVKGKLSASILPRWRGTRGVSFAVSVAELSASLDVLISGTGDGSETRTGWWTYENGDCGYRLVVHPAGC